MPILRKCENCAFHWDFNNACLYHNVILDDKYEDEWELKETFKKCKENDDFIPKEELARKDEKHKFITLLKSDLENYEGLANENAKSNNIDELIGNNAVIRYIKETIEVLKEE